MRAISRSKLHSRTVRAISISSMRRSAGFQVNGKREAFKGVHACCPQIPKQVIEEFLCSAVYEGNLGTEDDDFHASSFSITVSQLIPSAATRSPAASPHPSGRPPVGEKLIHALRQSDRMRFGRVPRHSMGDKFGNTATSRKA